MIRINTFWGDLSGISAITATLPCRSQSVSWAIVQALCFGCRPKTSTSAPSLSQLLVMSRCTETALTFRSPASPRKSYEENRWSTRHTLPNGLLATWYCSLPRRCKTSQSRPWLLTFRETRSCSLNLCCTHIGVQPVLLLLTRWSWRHRIGKRTREGVLRCWHVPSL